MINFYQDLKSQSIYPRPWLAKFWLQSDEQKNFRDSIEIKLKISAWKSFYLNRNFHAYFNDLKIFDFLISIVEER